MQTLVYTLATFAMILIGVGLFFASDRRRHVPLMIGAFVLDMIGLVIVEFTANPFTMLAERGDGWTMRVFHASVATLALVGYVVQMVTGRQLLRANRAKLGLHRQVARYFVICRVLAYVTMFML